MDRDNPNIIWVVWDTCRKDFTMTEYQGKELTPNLSQLSQDSITFSNAFSAAPWTPPSHASMFTGHYPSSHGYLEDGMELKKPHIAEVLSEHGYDTVSVSSASKLSSYTPLSNGFDEMYETFRLPSVGMENIWKYYGQIAEDWMRFVPQYLFNRQKMGYLTTSYLKHCIDAVPNGDSLFAFVNYLIPHSGYEPLEPFRSRFNDPTDNVRDDVVEELSFRGGYRYIAGELSVTDDEWEAVKARYAGEIAYVDSLLGHLIDHLKNKGVYDDTMIIVTSDHGEHFGEHNRAYHQFSLYDELLHVPLVVKMPDSDFAGRDVSNVVSLTDIFSTITDIVSIQNISSQGTSIYPPDTVDREYVFAEYGRPISAIENLQKYAKNTVDQDLLNSLDVSLQCVRSQDLKLIEDSKGRYQSFDLCSDPEEQVNLTENSEPPKSIQPLREAMESRLSELPEVRSNVPDETAIEENLKTLGYR